MSKKNALPQAPNQPVSCILSNSKYASIYTSMKKAYRRYSLHNYFDNIRYAVWHIVHKKLEKSLVSQTKVMSQSSHTPLFTTTTLQQGERLNHWRLAQDFQMLLFKEVKSIWGGP